MSLEDVVQDIDFVTRRREELLAEIAGLNEEERRVADLRLEAAAGELFARVMPSVGPARDLDRRLDEVRDEIANKRRLIEAADRRLIDLRASQGAAEFEDLLRRWPAAAKESRDAVEAYAAARKAIIAAAGRVNVATLATGRIWQRLQRLSRALDDRARDRLERLPPAASFTWRRDEYYINVERDLFNARPKEK